MKKKKVFCTIRFKCLQFDTVIIMLFRSKTMTVLLSKKQSAKVPQIFASVDTSSRKTTRKRAKKPTYF
jgi:hypothetical protein